MAMLKQSVSCQQVPNASFGNLGLKINNKKLIRMITIKL